MPSLPRPPGPKGLPILGSALAHRRDRHIEHAPAIALRPNHPVRLRIAAREVSHG